MKECVERLERYLLHSAVGSGAAIQAARDDYRNVSKDRQMLAALPKAWSQLIADEDDLLLEIVADRVESLCGFKPDPDMVAGFLKASVSGRAAAPTPVPCRSTGQPAPRSQTSQPAVLAKVIDQPALRIAENPPIVLANPMDHPPRAAATAPMQAASPHSEQIGFSFHGQFHPSRNAIDTLRQVFEIFIKRDPTFGERFAGLPKHGRTRRYLALDANDLYRDRPDLVSECSVKLGSGWWMSTNHSKQTLGQIIAMACDVAQVAYGRDLVPQLG